MQARVSNAENMFERSAAEDLGWIAGCLYLIVSAAAECGKCIFIDEMKT